ncbi:MAG: Zn-ribbon domain-containing OB-fold protein [Chloroflexota bacterium]|nr:MAG: Zn-ribbon domain-containing OB-fold protein [Chloroflexota bacterium]
MAEAPAVTYYSTLDLFPQQTAEHNKLYEFYDNLRKGVLTTSKCNACGYVAWPPRTICPECLSDQLHWTELPTRGKIDVFTVQWAGMPPGFEVPLILAIVVLPGGPTFLSRIVETLPEEVKDGCAVELVVLPVDRERVTYAFRLIRS